MRDSVGAAHGDVFNGTQIVGGRLSLDGANDFFRTAAIGGGTILAVGSNEEVAVYIGPRTRVVAVSMVVGYE